MNVFKYIWYNLKEFFTPRDDISYNNKYVDKVAERYQIGGIEYTNYYKQSNKPKRQYNRATKQQVARIKVLVGRGKTAKQIAKDVGLPYDNVNYYVKKFGG